MSNTHNFTDDIVINSSTGGIGLVLNTPDPMITFNDNTNTGGAQLKYNAGLANEPLGISFSSDGTTYGSPVFKMNSRGDIAIGSNISPNGNSSYTGLTIGQAFMMGHKSNGQIYMGTNVTYDGQWKSVGSGNSQLLAMSKDTITMYSTDSSASASNTALTFGSEKYKFSGDKFTVTPQASISDMRIAQPLAGTTSTSNDVTDDYILLHLHKDNEPADARSANQVISGTITGYRGSTGSYNRKVVIDVNSGTAYESTTIVVVNKGGTASSDKNTRTRPVKFTYDGKVYVGLKIPQGSTVGNFSFTGRQVTTGEALRMVHGNDSKLSGVEAIDSAEMDIPGRMTASGVGLLNKDDPQKETMTLGGGGAGQGSKLSMKNSDGNETVGMTGGNGAGSLGNSTIKGSQSFKNADGDETLKLDGGSTSGSGSKISLKNTDGKETMSMSSGGSGKGGDFSVKNSGGNETFAVGGGDGSSATAATSIKGDLSMKNADGTETMKLDGGASGEGGSQSIKNASGTDTVVFAGGGANSGGSQTINNGSGDSTYEVSGGGANGGSKQTFKDNNGNVTVETSGGTSDSNGASTSSAGTSYKNSAGVETLSLVVNEGGGGLQVKDSEGNSTVNMDGETGGLDVEGTASITNAEIVQTTTETVFVEDKIELTPGATNKAPEFSPTGAAATGVRGIYYCPFTKLHFTITAFGQMSRSSDGKTWETCRCTGLGGGAIQCLSSTRLSNGVIRFYADMNNAFRGSSSANLMISDDLCDSWTGVSNYVNIVNSYYAGNRDNTPRTINIGHDRDVETESTSQTGFAVSVYGYGVSYQREYFNDCATDVAMQRRWKRWILSRLKMQSQQTDNDGWRTANPNGNYFGGTTSVSNAYDLLTDAELDQIHFPIASWWTKYPGDTNIAYTAGWYNYYINSTDYGYDWDIWVGYAGTYPGSTTTTWIIGGLRAMHIHKVNGGTINSSFISSQSGTTRPFIMYINYNLSGQRYNADVGALGAGWNGVGTSQGQMMARVGRFIPKEYLLTTSGINTWSEGYINTPGVDDYYTYTLTRGQYDSGSRAWYQWRTDSPYSSNDGRPDASMESNRSFLPHPTNSEDIISVDSVGRVITLDTSAVYNWIRSDASSSSYRQNYSNPVAPPLRLEYETATVGGVTDVFVGDETVNPGAFFRDNIGYYQMDWDYKNIVGAGANGVAAVRAFKDTYASESSIWTNTYANGLRVPTFVSLIPHYETATITGTFPAVYEIKSIDPITMSGQEEWGSSIWNTTSTRSQNFTFHLDQTHKYSNPDTVRKTPSFTATQSDRSGMFIPTPSGWEYIRADSNSGGVNLDNAHAYGFISTKNTSNVHGTGQVFPGWRPGYQSVSYWVQRADGKWTVFYQMRMNDYSGTYNYPNGGYAAIGYTFTDTYPATSSGASGTGEYICLNARSTTPGWMWGCHTYLWDGDGVYRGNANYDTSRFEGNYGVNSRICADNNWWSDAWSQNMPRWAANNMRSRVDGTWHPDSGETLTVAWDGPASAPMHDNSYWTYELWLCNRPGGYASRPSMAVKLRDLSVVSDASYTAGSRSGSSHTAWMQLSKSSTLSNKNITQYLTDTASGVTVSDYGYTDASSSSRTEYYIGLVARYKNSSNNTSGVKIKVIRTRTGSSAWPDEPYAWQIDAEWLNDNNVEMTTPFYHAHKETTLLAGVHQPGTALMMPYRNTSDHFNVLGQRWTYLRTSDLSINEQSQSGWNDLYNNIVSRYNAGETVQQIINANRGYHPSGTTGTVFPAAYDETFASQKAILCRFYSRNTASGTNSIVREIDGMPTMALVTATNSDQIIVRKYTVPQEFADGQSYMVRWLPENNVVYFIFKNIGKIYWGNVGSHSTLTGNLANQRTGPIWTLITPSETGIANPTDIVYAPSIEKFMLVGESGIYVTSSTGVNSWESKLFPQYSFAAKPDTGMYKDTDHNLHMCHNGAKKLSLTSDDVQLLIDTEFNANITASNLPTSNPGVAGRIWNDGGTLKIS